MEFGLEIQRCLGRWSLSLERRLYRLMADAFKPKISGPEHVVNLRTMGTSRTFQSPAMTAKRKLSIGLSVGRIAREPMRHEAGEE